jgi:hypothetical protein
VHAAVLPEQLDQDQAPLLHELRRWRGELRQLDQRRLYGDQLLILGRPLSRKSR